ncbi:penicillin acylase family protein [Pleionea sp. CnH1-48]|uniref:penicillin acylase family protein n=1 Tax=Pleionea sp. CnH1-48 TaxID=2954494 RepID=UPI002096FD7E|nr:penicillin acylase family protein [Pleionea sp. CnH1-48]MCO7224325.1 penicillin acylase family protein [Pleionea sp. CnH1-48]
MKTIIRTGQMLLAVGLLAGCSSLVINTDVKKQYKADITRTNFGVPHIRAQDLGSLSFGNAYAQAQDNLCLMADNYVRVRGETSRYWGADKEENGDGINLQQDFRYRALALVTEARRLFPQLSVDAQTIIKGYVAGYNQYLQQAAEQPNMIPALCRGAEWLTPIKPEDVLAHLFSIAVFPGAAQFGEEYFLADPHSESEQDLAFNAPYEVTPAIGSNAWALGDIASKNARGMLLANPHFPYEGNMRFWQVHHQIDDELNVMGASLVGFPGVINIGFNEHIGWSHTYSSAEHFVIYQMQTHQSDPMTYVVDGEVKQVKSRSINIDVRTNKGIEVFSKRHFYTDVGPVIENEELAWSAENFYILKDVNLYNLDMIDHWLALNRSSSLAEAKQAYHQYHGLAFNNTLLTSKQGQALYIGDIAVPDLSSAALELLISDTPWAHIRAETGLSVLPGNRSDLMFNTSVPFQRVPTLETRDFVQNSNDSHWATHPQQLLEGYSPLFGEETDSLTLRTRMGLKLLSEGKQQGGFTLATLEQSLLSDRSYLAELILDELKSLCSNTRNFDVVLSEELTVNIQQACSILKQWDGKFNAQGKGALILRELAFVIDMEEDFEVPFDPTQPAHTPRQLKQSEEVLQKLALTVANLQVAGWSLDATVNEFQFIESTTAAGEPAQDRLPWPGLFEEEGGFNMMATWSWDESHFPRHYYEPAMDLYSQEPMESGLTSSGYQVRFGSSWMYILSYTEKGPEARGLLVYSQSSDPASDHFSDQNKFYSHNKALVPLPFTQEQIDQQAKSSITVFGTRLTGDVLH